MHAGRDHRPLAQAPVTDSLRMICMIKRIKRGTKKITVEPDNYGALPKDMSGFEARDDRQGPGKRPGSALFTCRYQPPITQYTVLVFTETTIIDCCLIMFFSQPR